MKTFWNVLDLITYHRFSVIDVIFIFWFYMFIMASNYVAAIIFLIIGSWISVYLENMVKRHKNC